MFAGSRQDFSLRELLLCITSKRAKPFSIRQASLGEIYGGIWPWGNYGVSESSSSEHHSGAAVCVCVDPPVLQCLVPGLSLVVTILQISTLEQTKGRGPVPAET